jgi:hypothetical protein
MTVFEPTEEWVRRNSDYPKIETPIQDIQLDNLERSRALFVKYWEQLRIRSLMVKEKEM